MGKTLENFIKTGKNIGLILGTSLALLTGINQKDNKAYSQISKEEIKTTEISEFPVKDLKVTKIPLWRIISSEGIVADLDISGNNKVMVFEHRQKE